MTPPTHPSWASSLLLAALLVQAQAQPQNQNQTTTPPPQPNFSMSTYTYNGHTTAVPVGDNAASLILSGAGGLGANSTATATGMPVVANSSISSGFETVTTSAAVSGPGGSEVGGGNGTAAATAMAAPSSMVTSSIPADVMASLSAFFASASGFGAYGDVSTQSSSGVVSSSSLPSVAASSTAAGTSMSPTPMTTSAVVPGTEVGRGNGTAATASSSSVGTSAMPADVAASLSAFFASASGFGFYGDAGAQSSSGVVSSSTGSSSVPWSVPISASTAVPTSTSTTLAPTNLPPASTSTVPQNPASPSGTFHQMNITHDLRLPVTINETGILLALDTTGQCSWLIDRDNFDCRFKGVLQKQRADNSCHDPATFADVKPMIQLPRGNASEGHCDYMFGHTRVEGKRVDATLKAGDTELTVENLLLANTFSSDEVQYVMSNAMGVLGLLSTPYIAGIPCRISSTASKLTWNHHQHPPTATANTTLPNANGTTLLYLAARRNTITGSGMGILTHGAYPPNTPLIGTLPSYSVRVRTSPVATSQLPDRYQCSYRIAVDDIVTNTSALAIQPPKPEAALLAGDYYLIDTLSRFNVVSPDLARNLSEVFEPRGQWDEGTGLVEVDCAAQLANNTTVSVVIAGMPVRIDAGDMVVRDYPEAGRCFSAFRGGDDGDEQRTLQVVDRRLGWPFLWGAGVGLEIGERGGGCVEC